MARYLGRGEVAFARGGDAVAFGDDGGDRAIAIGGGLRELQRQLRGGGRLCAEGRGRERSG